MKRILTGLAVCGLLAGAQTAHAASLGSITTSDGLEFALSSTPSGADLIYTLTLDTSGYSELPGETTDYISWVSVNGVFHDTISQTAAPDASWVFHDGAANNSSGCNDNLASGKWCSQTASTNTMLNGSTYTWMWDVHPTGAVIDPAHLQAAWFDPDTGKKENAISLDFGSGTSTGEETTGSETTGSETTGNETTGNETTGSETTGGEVPEPASLLLLGSGLAGAALRFKRNRK